MWWIVNSINRPILIDKVGLDGVGLYSVAGKFPSILSIVFTIFFSAFQISALEEFEKPSFRTFYTNVFRALLFIQIGLVFIFELFGGLLFNIFIDEKFYEAVHYLPILSAGVVLSNIAAYVGISFTVVKRTKYFLYSAILSAITALVSNLFLIPLWGIMGACISIILSQMVMVLYRLYKSRVYVQFDNHKPIILIIVICLLSILFYYFTDNIFIRTIVISILFLFFLMQNRDIFSYLKLLKTK